MIANQFDMDDAVSFSESAEFAADFRGCRPERAEGNSHHLASRRSDEQVRRRAGILINFVARRKAGVGGECCNDARPVCNANVFGKRLAIAGRRENLIDGQGVGDSFG